MTKTIETFDLTKFGDLVAVDRLDISVKQGEVFAARTEWRRKNYGALHKLFYAVPLL